MRNLLLLDWIRAMGERRRTHWVADFETTTTADDCRIWVWGIVNLDSRLSLGDVQWDTSMDSFVDECKQRNSVVYFHNLAFDGSFILDWLFRNGYTHTGDRPGKRQFATLISNMGKFYSMTVQWDNGKTTEFRDSLKKLPFSAANVAKAFKLEETKGEIDYDAPRPVGYVPSPAEIDYLARDIIIIAKAMKTQLDAGMNKLTVGADSLAEFKAITGKKLYDKMFPVLPASMDAEIRAAYRGGFAYADKRFAGKPTGPGRVYDVNSLYPSVMYDELLPYGEPVYCDGLPEVSELYPLFIVSITFTAKLKPDHIPCIQVKGSSFFLATEYQRNIKEPVTMTCTNVDLDLWNDHYDMDILSYNGGWQFMGIHDVFNDFIDKWMHIKATSDGGMRVLAKLQLNSLYGKFATNPDVTPKIPIMEDNHVKLVTGDPESRDPIYTALGVFITAYARDKTIRAAQTHYDTFAYADTDSLHLLIAEDSNQLDIHPSNLGAWKFEYAFQSGLFIQAKRYSEQLADGSYVTHVAGLPEKIAHQLTFEDFSNGKRFAGKLVPRRVPGGIVLEDVGFTFGG